MIPAYSLPTNIYCLECGENVWTEDTVETTRCSCDPDDFDPRWHQDHHEPAGGVLYEHEVYGVTDALYEHAEQHAGIKVRWAQNPPGDERELSDPYVAGFSAGELVDISPDALLDPPLRRTIKSFALLGDQGIIAIFEGGDPVGVGNSAYLDHLTAVDPED